MLFSAKVAVVALVITGTSLTLVTVIATASVSVNVPSLAITLISYILFAPLSLGNSKLGAVLKVTAPLLMLKRLASVPDKL